MKPRTISRLSLFFLIYSAVALVVTFVVHVALYFGFNLRTAAPNVWTAIQLSIALTAMGVVFIYRHPAPHIMEVKPEGTTIGWVLVILYAVFLFYALFNVFYLDRKLHYGFLDFSEGHYVIALRSRIVKSVLPPELETYQLYQARKYSGHWMICNTVLCLFASMNTRWANDDEQAVGVIEGADKH